ncbi:hypothetical protein J2W49_003960 [Hydrogenophaga palleronii]|uniref:Uncharacterized protein n=1 Tax=Hydrogenophaga palleronii TaxID=65655 RepID=A0ABU1WRQ5_9BURK|nr:hypothetical protein [Hydrogenophaga palleronii]MDR7151984.1 hypothetical protein [Hydrogenophaga palleronii]
MRINSTGTGITPNEIQNTGSTSGTAGSPASLPVGDLRPRGSTSDMPPRLNLLPLPASSTSQVNTQLSEVTSLLNAGGLGMLQQRAKDSFESLPSAYRSLATQTARLVGVMSDPTPSGSAMPFPELGKRLEAVTSASAQLVEATKLDLASALQLEPQQRAAMLAPHLNQLKEACNVTAQAVAQMPVAELRANREVVKEQLTALSRSTETVHEQLKAQLGETDPATVAALEARTAASAAYGKTMLRMAAANLGNMAFNITVGPVISGLNRLFGANS